MKKMQLFSKTFLYTMIVMSLIIFVAHMLIYTLLPNTYMKQKQQETTTLMETVRTEMEGKSLEEMKEIAKAALYDTSASLTLQQNGDIYFFSGVATMENVGSQQESIAIPNEEEAANTTEKHQEEIFSQAEQFSSSSISVIPHTTISDQTVITLQQTVTMKDQTNIELIVSMSLQPVNEATMVMFQILPYTIGISILLSLCAAYFYARAITKPIQKICASTREMEQLKPNAHCEVTSQDEIGILANDINHLYDSLQNTIISLENEIAHVSQLEQMKVDFLRSASHELKTPLTSLSLMLENMMFNIGKYQDHDLYLKKCKEHVDHLSQMVKDIIDTSSFEPQLGIHPQSIQVKEWISRILEPYLFIMKTNDIKLSINCDEETIYQDQEAMNKVLSNILSNAAHYTKPGGKIEITFQHHCLLIDNECTPLDEVQLQHIFEAFYRPDFARNKQYGGNGLGLYIVDQILTMAKLPYEFIPYAQGMRFQIMFPAE